MKTYKYLFIALVSAFLTVGCSDDLEYTPGEVQGETYGVYFPEQRMSSRIELEPNHKTQVTYVAKRTNVQDEITVPVVVTPSVKNVFVVEPIRFAAGQDETSFTIYFPEAQVGTEYTCALSIEDPRYVSIYSEHKSNLSFSVLRASWRSLGVGKWRDDVISSLYGVPNPYGEIEVEIFEREDKKGLYRMKAFTSDLLYALFDIPNVPTEGKFTMIDATDPDNVWIPKQSTGCKISDQEGVITIASYVDKQFSIDASDSMYGTLKNGVITFPAQSIYCNLAAAMSPNQWFPGNTQGMQRIMLPGSRLYDYSVSLSKSEPKDGVVAIKAVFGTDVKKMKYAYFEGAVDSGIAGIHAQDMDAGTIEIDGEITESSILEARLPKTGVYTLVGCIYDEQGLMQDYTSLTFGYIAQGDEKPVILTIGLEGTNELGGQGITTDNATKFYAFGQGIERMEYVFIREDKIGGKTDEQLLNEAGQFFSPEQLAAVNNGSFRTMFTNLNGDRTYKVVVRAYNGFVTKILSASYKTTGQFNPAWESYTSEDFKMLPLPLSTLQSTQWNYYATDMLQRNPVRRYYGKASVKRNAQTSMLNLFGLTTLTFDKEGEGALEAQYDGRIMMALSVGKMPIGTVDSQDVVVSFVADEQPNYTYTGTGLILGALVADGYIFFAANPDIQQSNDLTFSSLLIRKGSTPYKMMKDLLLVDSSKDITKIPAHVEASIAAFKHTIQKELTVDNYVELQGMERLKALLEQGVFQAPVRNEAQGWLEASMPLLGKVKAQVSVRKPVVQQPEKACPLFTTHDLKEVF